MKQHNSNNTSLTRTFIHMGDQPTNIDPNDIDIIAKYIYNCYGLDTSSGTSFEALRLHQLLNTPNTCLRTLGPSVSAIEQHVRRACIQAWYLWKLSHLELDIPDPTSWAGSGLQYLHFPTSLYDKLVVRLMSVLYWKRVVH